MRLSILAPVTVCLLLASGPTLRGQGDPARRDKALAQIKRIGGRVFDEPGGKGVAIAFPYEATDADLKLLADVPDVRVVYLDRTKVTDAGLEHLKGLANLQEVTLRKTDVTAEGVQALKRARPGVFVTYEPWRKPFSLTKLLFGIVVCGLLMGVGAWLMRSARRKKGLAEEFRVKVFFMGAGLALAGVVLFAIAFLQALGFDVSLSNLFD